MRSPVLASLCTCGVIVVAACADLIGPAPSADGAGAAEGTTSVTGTGSPASGASASNAQASASVTAASASASSGGSVCFDGPLANLNASRIAVGEDHVCAVRPGSRPGATSVLTCFGRNDAGQVTPGDCGADPCPPTEVDLTSVFGSDRPKVVAAGDRYTCVVSEGGTIACFGQSLPGGLGGNALGGFARPGIPGVDYVAARGDTTCLMAETGDARTLSCFGENDRGQIDGDRLNAMTPVLVANDALDVAVGNHFILFQQPEGVYAQGKSDSDVVSQGACDSDLTAPSLIQSCVLADPTQIVGGDDFACMLLPTQSKCWGHIPFLGGACTPNGCSLPTCNCQNGVLGAERIAAGRAHVCALTKLATERHITCAGDGPAAGSTDMTLPFEPIDVATSHDVSCALGACGQVACWGNGADGQLGARLTISAAPVVVIP